MRASPSTARATTLNMQCVTALSAYGFQAVPHQRGRDSAVTPTADRRLCGCESVAGGGRGGVCGQGGQDRGHDRGGELGHRLLGMVGSVELFEERP